MDDAFRHEALLYAGDEGFVTTVAPFIREGVEAGEPTLVVVGARKIDLLREALGRDAESVRFADMAAVGHNPARIIPAWEEFVLANAAPGVRVRGVGEPIFPERRADELVECQRHESLLNLAFADANAFWLVCPYDTEALPPEVIGEALRSHPVVGRDDVHEESPLYRGLGEIAAPFEAPLSEPPAGAPTLRFGADTLEAVRHFVVAESGRAGLPEGRRGHLVIATNEIASNSVEYGGGDGAVSLWAEDGRVVCEVRDAGRILDPLADRRRPAADALGGRGLWIANQLCDLVQVRTFREGTAVRLHMALP